PVKRIFCDFREGPLGWCSIRANAYLNDIFTAPTTDLVFPMIMNGVPPVDSPGLDRRIPHAQRGPKHVLRLVRDRASSRTYGHDPDILDSSPIQSPPEMCLT